MISSAIGYKKNIEDFSEWHWLACSQSQTRTRIKAERPTSASQLRWMGTKWDAIGPDFLSFPNCLLKNKAHFWLNAYVNKQNCGLWNDDSQQATVEVSLCPPKCSICMVVLTVELTCPYFRQTKKSIIILQSMENTIEPWLMTFSYFSWMMLMWTTFSLPYRQWSKQIFVGNFWWVNGDFVSFNITGLIFVGVMWNHLSM